MLDEIKLRNVTTGQEQSFRFDHVVRLLNYEKSIKVTCWELPPDSKYIFKDGKLIQRPSDRANKTAKEREGDSEGEKEKDPA